MGDALSFGCVNSIPVLSLSFSLAMTGYYAPVARASKDGVRMRLSPYAPRWSLRNVSATTQITFMLTFFSPSQAGSETVGDAERNRCDAGRRCSPVMWKAKILSITGGAPPRTHSGSPVSCTASRLGRGDRLILPGTISEEPLAPVVPHGDDQCSVS